MHFLLFSAIAGFASSASPDTSKSPFSWFTRRSAAHFRITFDTSALASRCKGDKTSDCTESDMLSEKSQRLVEAALQRVKFSLERLVDVSSLHRPLDFSKISLAEEFPLTTADFKGSDFVAKVEARELEDATVTAVARTVARDVNARPIAGIVTINTAAVPKDESGFRAYVDDLRRTICAGFWIGGRPDGTMTFDYEKGAVLLEDADGSLGSTLANAFKVNTNGWIGIGVSLVCFVLFVVLGCLCQKRANRKFQKQQDGIKAEREKRRKQALRKKRAQNKRKARKP